MRKLWFKPLVTLIILLAGPAVQAGQARDQLEIFLHQLSSFEADFQQRLTDEQGRLIEESEGQFYLQRPGKFRWEYTLPYTQSIIADGERLWIYDKELEQVTVNSMQTALSNTPARLLSGDLVLDDEFSIEELGEINGINWLALQPMQTDGQFAAIRMGFDQAGLSIMAIADNFGQVTKISFSHAKRNQSIDAAQFNFTPPAGVDVIDATTNQ
jgi:outer membrane lipoprotein carrier protein